jgi:hypothetical protein
MHDQAQDSFLGTAIWTVAALAIVVAVAVYMGTA